MDARLRRDLNSTGPLVSALALTRAFPMLRLFPVRPIQKTPCLVGWQEKATSQGDELCELWNEARKVLGALMLGGGYPDVGLATGKPGGVFVVDCDSPDAAYWFEATFCVPGPHVTTSRGGHYYFACPPNEADIPRNSASRIYPKVDVRGVGGLVVAPPSSRKTGGRYEWTEHCEYAFPYQPTELLLSLCKPPEKPQRAYTENQHREHAGASLERIVANRIRLLQSTGEGNRNERLYKSAFLFGSMARGAPASRGPMEDACRELIRVAIAIGLPAKEAERTAWSSFEEGCRVGSFTIETKDPVGSDAWEDVGNEL